MHVRLKKLVMFTALAILALLASAQAGSASATPLTAAHRPGDSVTTNKALVTYVYNRLLYQERSVGNRRVYELDL